MRKKFLVFCCAAALAVSAAGCSPAEKAPAQETQTEQQTEAPETEESSQEAEGSAQAGGFRRRSASYERCD